MTRSNQELELQFGHEIINWEMSDACSTHAEWDFVRNNNRTEKRSDILEKWYKY